MAARQPYLNADGKKVPAVTTIMGRYKDSGALIWWANQVGLGEHESCEDQERCPRCNRRPGRNHREVAQAAADVGNLAHDMIEEEVKNVPVDRDAYAHLDDEQWDMAYGCLEAFNRWRDGFGGLEFIETEFPLVSERYQFGGRIDALARTKDGALIIPDWKTSRGLYQDHIGQLGAYGLLIDEADIWGEVEEYHVLRISKESAGFHHSSWTAKRFQPARGYFLKARELYELEAPLKKLLK